jgi:hypothetical protein
MTGMLGGGSRRPGGRPGGLVEEAEGGGVRPSPAADEEVDEQEKMASLSRYMYWKSVDWDARLP